jgi:hypothetical protein
MNKMIKLPDGTYINPKYVVRIEVRTSNAAQDNPRTLVWTADGGYATAFDGDRRDEIAALLVLNMLDERKFKNRNSAEHEGQAGLGTW